MNNSTLLLLIPACFALNMAPGPNNLLSVNNATHYGFWTSCFAGTERLIAFSAMIALTVTGLPAALEASELLFYGVKILGAAYLFYLSFKLWTAKIQKQRSDSWKQRNFMHLAKQEFLIATGNPKAILIFTAFLPQFIDSAHDVAPQFATLGALFLALEMVALAGYALIGLHLRRWFNEPQGKRLFNRICAVLLSRAASVLLATRRA